MSRRKSAIGQRVTGHWKAFKSAFHHFVVRFHFRVIQVNNVLGIINFVASVATVVSLFVLVGFDHSADSSHTFRHILRTAQGIFTFSILFNLIFNFRETTVGSRWLKWIVEAGVLLMLLPLMYPHPEHPWLPWLERLLYSPYTLGVCLGAYAFVDICYGMSRMLSRRANPSILLGASFLVFIICGSFLLMMPKCTYESISYADSLFVSGSAVCITGLTPVNIATTFTPLGQTVIAVLAEIGALGILTFTSFFAIFFSGSQSIYNQLLLRDMVYSKTMNALVPTLLYVLSFTILVQIAGAVAIYYTVPDALGLGVEDKIAFSFFQSLSSFCNLGFTTLPDGMATETLLNGNQLIYIVVSILVFAGGIGFPILVNFKDITFRNLRHLWRRILHRNTSQGKRIHIYDFNTKLVLFTTIIILILGSSAFFVLESDNSMKGMSLYQRIVQSVFNSLSPRSSGFVSLNPATFLNATLLIIIFQMWIGGASQSMAGGIKVNTFATVLLNLRSIVMNRKGVNAFHRNVALGSVRRANAIVTLSIISVFAFTITIMLLEPAMPAKWTVYEVFSALFTVGSSLGATEHLCTASKIVLTVAMFVGRVGLLSLIIGLTPAQRDLSEHYPSENVIIN